jgi:DNA-binding HxlR family transcriptional regulator
MTQLTKVEDMERKSFSDMRCSIAQCLEIIGEWWSMLIIRDAFLGVSRFDDFQKRLGISRNVLNQRLAHLSDAGVLDRVPYREHPPRFEYRLSEKGRDLWPILSAMREWGDRYAAPEGPPVLALHKTCGQVIGVVPTCSACGSPIDARDVIAVAGPGGGAALLPVRAGSA